MNLCTGNTFQRLSDLVHIRDWYIYLCVAWPFLWPLPLRATIYIYIYIVTPFNPGTHLVAPPEADFC